MTRITGNYRWIMLLLGFFITTIFAVGMQVIPPILELLVDDIGITYAQAGGLMSVFSLPGFLVAVLWGIAISKFGSLRIGALSISLFIVGTSLCLFATDYGFLLVGRTLMGIGAQALPIIGVSTVSEWFIGNEIGLALGFYTASVPLGTIVALLFYGPLGILGGWRLPILITAVLGVILLILFLALYKPAPSINVQTPLTRKSMKTVFIVILPIILGWLFYQGSGASYTTFAPSYFLGIGYSVEIASLYGSAWMLGSLVLSPVIGGIVDRRGNLVHLITIGGGFIILGFGIIIVLPESSLFAMFSLSFGATLSPVAFFALMPRLLKPDQTKLGYSLLSSGASIGAAIGPVTAGLLRDITGNYSMSFVGMAVFMLFTMLTVLPLYKRDLSRST